MYSIKDFLSAMAEIFNAKMSEFQQELHKSLSPFPTVFLSAEFSSFRTFIIAALTRLKRHLDIEEEKIEETNARVTSLFADHLELPTFTSSSIKFSHHLAKTRTIETSQSSLNSPMLMSEIKSGLLRQS
ncbi:unnamed protein product [Euphydryas editha]|uniref:Uncharacterized protein n=1 Tax=Euphydryas editha TaxID=104508 RepID=A0AAU9U4H8_EUPED|nr:unnamed protein product [Euphydryas editha]